MSFFSSSPIGIGLSLSVLVIGWLVVKTGLNTILIDVISRILDSWLSRRYSISDIDGRSTIPGCRYRFPNGQGDEAKFLHGKENSEAWGARYGSIFRIWAGMTPEIVLTRPEHVMAFFKDSHRHTKASSNDSGYLMSQILGQCLGLISGKKWQAVKEAVEQPFHRSTSINYLDLIQRRTHDHLSRGLGSGFLPSGEIDPAEDFKMLPFIIVAEIIYGPLERGLEQRLRELAPEREKLFHHVIRGGLSRFSFSKYLPTKANRDLVEFQKKWSQLNEDLYASAIHTSSSAPIIQMFRTVESGSVSKPQILQTLDEMLFANLDVTIGAISWNLVFLAANKHVQDQVRAEIVVATTAGAGVVGSRKEGKEEEEEGKVVGKNGLMPPPPPPPRLFEEYLQDGTSLLSACICESSRLRPLAGFSVPQAAPTDRLVGGYLIPAGTNAVVDTYALNIGNDFWGHGKDAAEYRPSRFLERTGTELRYNYWRFGFGPRQCLGRHVADLMVRCLIASLLDGYELALVDDSSSPKAGIGKEGDGEMTKDGGHDDGWERVQDCWINHPNLRIRCVRRGVTTL